MILRQAFYRWQKGVLTIGLCLGISATGIGVSAQSRQGSISPEQTGSSLLETQLAKDQKVLSLARQVIATAHSLLLMTKVNREQELLIRFHRMMNFSSMWRLSLYQGKLSKFEVMTK